MFKTKNTASTIEFTISSDMTLENRVIDKSQKFLKKYKLKDFSNFKLVLRELLNNAIEHGNYNIPQRTVTCRIEHIREKRFKIIVEDEGQGFDYEDLVMSLPEDPRQIRNRGFALINAFTDQIDFNVTGNRISVYMSFLDETTFQVQQKGEKQIMTPSGDLTAVTAEKFRARLIDLLDKGFTRYRFDFSRVEDIDSVSLSVMILFARTLCAKTDRGVLEICNLSKDLMDLFYMTHMDQLYDII